MSWDYVKSVGRIRHHLDYLDQVGPLSVSKLRREMDLENLSETNCREIYGAHVYISVSNFSALVSSSTYASDDHKRLIRAVHLYQREVSRIVEDIFDGVRVHFQGAKLHALFYRPIDNGTMIAVRAMLLPLVIKEFLRDVFNRMFPYDDFTIAAGIDIGTVIGTRNGARGDRELLFLGPAANHAAKILSSHGSVRLTERLYEVLPKDAQAVCWQDTEGYYRVQATLKEVTTLLKDNSIDWSSPQSRSRVEADLAALPLHAITVSGARERIDKDCLSVYDNKAVVGASVYADVSGFTKYIDSMATNEGKITALRVFHAIRHEMSQVAKCDFDGVRIQYQGDRVQVLFHLPEGKDEAIAETAVHAAASFQSSMELSLKECLPDIVDRLHLAVGVDIGKTLVSKLGIRGQRDVICIGTPVEEAAYCEEATAGKEIGVTEQVYQLLSEDLAKLFIYDFQKKCYVAMGLTAVQLGWMERAKDYQNETPAYIRSGASGVTITNVRQGINERIVQPQRPWHP